MFSQTLLTLIDQREEYTILKKEVANTPLEKSIDSTIKIIIQDIDKITKLNQIKYIY